MILRAILEILLLYSFLISFLVLLVVYLYFKYSYTYWARKNVPYLKPKFPLGNLDCISGESTAYGMEAYDWYNELKRRGVKIGGVYSWSKPIITITDPEYIKDVLVKDFPIFVNREFYSNPKHDPENESLFVIKGEEWKLTRQKISPYFTSAKIKMMFDSLVINSEALVDALEDLADKKEETDIKEYIYDWTMDNIGSLFFGIEFNCLKDINSQFRIFGRHNIYIQWYRKPLIILTRLAEKLAKLLRISNFPADTTEMFSNVVRKNVEYRKKNNIIRQDYLQLLMNYHESDEGRKNGFNFNKVIANEILIFNAGFDTSATTLAFALYELSQQPNLQERARNEVRTILKKYNGKITFEASTEMTYLKQILEETLRMYPVLSAISRVTTKPYTFANTDITIPANTTVVISLAGLGRDPEYYPNPEIFDPERFNSENKPNIKPYSYLPFGGGPRNCVGARFGLVQATTGLALMLDKFRFISKPRTCSPVELKRGTFTSQSVKPIMLKLQKIN